ncbi:sporulation integral membrane protein YlbJ [Caloramator quimbayensis]|uniref:Sporulation integral membrane protein YlbJ n=1 Tax=Caloramator quimbayensis TaxID=1147123 RepID=A0A1T4XTC5_9CLOT|nr:hypothetical protein [Caloramator quimbayensis]SKA92301.1 sporulation integral membrane protein YlbJ [Caloramator quimbayensis]
MKYIFTIIITITFFMCFILKKNIKAVTALISTFLILLIFYPKASINGAKEGINLWMFIVIPSLLPFFIINDMLMSLKVPENIAKLFAPVIKLLFNTTGYGAYVFIMSIFSGYPSGAKIVNDLIKSKKISVKEGQKILTFSSTSGPLFIIGAVGSGMLKYSIAGYILYISHILGAILNGILFRFILKDADKNKFNYNNNFYSENYYSSSEIFSKAISSSLITCGLIGGYIIMFSVIIYLLREIQYFDIIGYLLQKFFHLSSFFTFTIKSLFETSLEISNGAKIISLMDKSFTYKMCLLSFIIAFSGLSIIGQVSGILSKSGINIKLYVISKVFHGIFSSLLCFIFIMLLNIRVFVFNIKNSASVLNVIVLLELLLIIILILNIISYKIKFSKN